MKSRRILSRSSAWAFISARVAIVLAVIAIGGGLLAYEWCHAHPAQTDHFTTHHHHHHDAKTAESSR